MHSYLQEMHAIPLETVFNPVIWKMLADPSNISYYHYEVDSIFYMSVNWVMPVLAFPRLVLERSVESWICFLLSHIWPLVKSWCVKSIKLSAIASGRQLWHDFLILQSGIEFPVKAIITNSKLEMPGPFPVTDKTYFMLLCVCVCVF